MCDIFDVWLNGDSCVQYAPHLFYAVTKSYSKCRVRRATTHHSSGPLGVNRVCRSSRGVSPFYVQTHCVKHSFFYETILQCRKMTNRRRRSSGVAPTPAPPYRFLASHVCIHLTYYMPRCILWPCALVGVGRHTSVREKVEELVFLRPPTSIRIPNECSEFLIGFRSSFTFRVQTLASERRGKRNLRRFLVLPRQSAPRSAPVALPDIEVWC